MPPLPMNKKMELFYIDADMMPLLVQENYLRSWEKNAPRGLSDLEQLDRCAKAANLIAMADSMQGLWEAQGSVAIMGTVYPAFLTPCPGLMRPSFPSWLQKRSGIVRSERSVQEMSSRMKAATTCSRSSLVTTNYHDILYRRLLAPLASGDYKGCASKLVAYGLSREFFTDQAPAVRQPLMLKEDYKTLDGKLKHQLLQEINDMTQQAALTKRKGNTDGDGGGARKKRTGADTVMDDGDDAEQEGGADEGPGMAKQSKGKKTSKSGKVTKASGPSGAGKTKASLGAWKIKAVTEDGNTQGAEAGAERRRKPILILKYIDGHSIAVRRKVKMHDLLGAWTMF